MVEKLDGLYLAVTSGKRGPYANSISRPIYINCSEPITFPSAVQLVYLLSVVDLVYDLGLINQVGGTRVVNEEAAANCIRTWALVYFFHFG